MKHYEIQYAEALQCFTNLINKNQKTKNRTGIDTFNIPQMNFHFNDNPIRFSALQCKKVNYQHSVVELLWMLTGRTDIQFLKDRGVNYWDEWQDENGTIGKSYGYQFRNFSGKDNFAQLIYELITNPMSRRLVFNIWNIADIEQMTLPPCVIQYQLLPRRLSEDKIVLDLSVFQRSTDSFLGLPYDMMFASLFLNFVIYIAEFKRDNYEQFIAGDIYYTANNFHLYENHIEQMAQYLSNFMVEYGSRYNEQSLLHDKHNLTLVNNALEDDFNNPTKYQTDFKSIQNIVDKKLQYLVELYKYLIKLENYQEKYGLIKAPVAV